MKFDDAFGQQIDQWIAWNKDEMVEQIIRLVSCKSVRSAPDGEYPFGREVASALDIALQLASEAGLETVNDAYYYGLATLPGTGEKKLGMFAHLDVVPEGNGWFQDPYQADIRDGYLVGRGVGDNKGPAIAALYAMKFLKEHKISLEKTVQLYLGCAEESGMEDIVYYTSRNTPPDFSFTPDVSFSVSYGEKGILEMEVQAELECPCLLQLQGGQASNVVAAEAFAVISNPTPETVEVLTGLERVTLCTQDENLLVSAQGVGKHAAFPEGSVNAVAILCAALAKVKQLGTPTQEKLGSVACLLEDFYGASLGVPYEDKASGKLTHTCGILRMADGKLELDFNIRYPIEAPVQEMKQRLQEQFRLAGFHITKLSNNPPAYVPCDSLEVQALNEICNHTLGTDLKPYTMGGGTYARKLPNAVGYGPGRNDRPRLFGSGHEPNECILIEDLENAVKIYIQALLALDKIV
ncbi:Sapep family Mn(2+)-dependent dipeptidase [Hydrogenoanaerobacterium sp.]|uniref:Sapep family Mn(2+)-dependent dipeptidase n=1 Tax=Hydrogenoanaerobacterium sp. TaxID=2953763 RepID=UPI0028A046E4|nr:Sapep family Mn(2+)-dependent dipeptidase [Hydrogenoanaerobacterium sp.]